MGLHRRSIRKVKKEYNFQRINGNNSEYYRWDE